MLAWLCLFSLALFPHVRSTELYKGITDWHAPDDGISDLERQMDSRFAVDSNPTLPVSAAFRFSDATMGLAMISFTVLYLIQTLTLTLTPNPNPATKI